METRRELTPEQSRRKVRQEMIDKIFNEIVHDAIADDSISLESDWEVIPPTEQEKKIGIRAARLCCEDTPIEIVQSEHWALYAPGVAVINGGEEPVFRGTIDNALEFIENKLGYRV